MIILKRETLKQKSKKDQIKKKKTLANFEKILYLSSAHSLGILMLQPRLATWVLSKSSWFGNMTKIMFFFCLQFCRGEGTKIMFFFVCNFVEVKDKLMQFFIALSPECLIFSLIFLWPVQTPSQMQIKRKTVMDNWSGISICHFPAFFMATKD